MISKNILPAEERRRRRAILLRRFAVLSGERPVHHDPESPWSRDYHSEGKVCLISEAYARRLAAALLWLGEDPQEPYTCGSGHWHLRQIAKSRARSERIKRERGHPPDQGLHDF